MPARRRLPWVGVVAALAVAAGCTSEPDPPPEGVLTAEQVGTVETTTVDAGLLTVGLGCEVPDGENAFAFAEGINMGAGDADLRATVVHELSDGRTIESGRYAAGSGEPMVGLLRNTQEQIDRCTDQITTSDRFRALTDLPRGAVGYQGVDARDDGPGLAYARAWIPVGDYLVLLGVHGPEGSTDPAVDLQDLLPEAVAAAERLPTPTS